MTRSACVDNKCPVYLTLRVTDVYRETQYPRQHIISTDEFNETLPSTNSDYMIMIKQTYREFLH